MNKLLEDILTIKKREELEYIKKLKLDPDFEKIDVNSGEDLLTQLIKIKKLDREKFDKCLDNAVIIQYLLKKNYEYLINFLGNPDIPMKEKRKMFGLKYSPANLRKFLLLPAGLLYMAIPTILYILLVPAIVSIGISIIFVYLSFFSPRFKQIYGYIIAVLYSRVLGLKKW